MWIIHTDIRNAGRSQLSTFFWSSDLTRYLKIPAFNHDLQVVQESLRCWAQVVKYRPRAHVFNLFPHGIFLWPCPSLNYLPGS